MTDKLRVEYATVENGSRGIAVGQELYFLEVQYQSGNKEPWGFKLFEMHEWKPQTAWINIKSPGKLRTSHKAKVLRKKLKGLDTIIVDEILERVIGQVQDHECEWNPTASEEKDQTKPQDTKLDPQIEQEAEDILNSENVLEAAAYHLDNILIGEHDNKRLVLILLLSGKLDDPSLKQIILIKAESGAGKSQLMRIADIFKTKTVGRFSPHALDFAKLEEHQILRLKELGSMDEEFQGVSTLKFLSADDLGYTVEMTIRDETGHFTTEEYRIPPITVITSTTRINLEGQFERRAWILNCDESEEQTKRIGKWKAKHEREKALVNLGQLKETSYDRSLKVLRAVIDKLEPMKPILCFPQSITDLIGSTKLRLRGDYDKFYALVKFYAILLQRTLPKSINAQGEKCVWITPSKMFEILQIAEGPYQTMASGLEERTRQLIDILEEKSVTAKHDIIDLDMRGEIAADLGKSSDTIYKYLNAWKKTGLVASKKSRRKGSPVEFKLLFDLATIKQKTIITFGISENLTEKALPFEKEALEFLTRLSEKSLGGTHIISSNSVKWEKGWSKDKVFDAMKVNGYNIPPPPEPFSEGESKADTPPISPNNALTVGDSKIPTVQTLQRRTASYSELAKLRQDKTPLTSIETLSEKGADRIPLTQKDEAIKPLNDQAIDKAFPLGPQETKPILTKDNLEKIWPHLPEQFEDGVFQQVAMEKAGLTREAADQLWEKFKDEERFVRVEDGKFWSLVR